MQRREQYLLIGLIAAVVLWGGWSMFHSTFVEPLQKSQQVLTKLEEDISKTETGLIELARQRKSLSVWTKRSLPPDPKIGRLAPDALNAQRLYQDWLHDLAQMSGFEDLKVSPGARNRSRDNVYVSVIVKVEGEARYEQLCRFLDRFYRTDLLHRVTALRIQSKESEGDPFLKIELDAEGLAITTAPTARRLFPQTVLIEELSDDATELKIDSNEDFPKEPGFLVRIKGEFMRVTAIDETTWIVDRAQEGTTAASEPAGTLIELVRLNDDVHPRTPEEFKRLLGSNLFIKPAPPVQYKPRIAPLGEKSLTRGRPIEFNIVAMNYDPSKGKPEYLLTSSIPGSRLDKTTGKFTWTPTREQKAGKYAFKVEIVHPSAPGGRLTETVNVTLRDPNTPPRIAVRTPPPVYLGREWQFALQATDAESGSNKLTWKLGEKTPKGMEIESRTGKLTWTPDDSTEIGEANVQVTVSDDGTPPQTGTTTLRLQVEDDAATFTYLTTIFAVNNKVLAKLYDRSQDKYTELRVGTKFSVADVQGTVTKIDKKYLEFASGDSTVKLLIGQSLREVAPEKSAVSSATTEPEIPDATRPANVTAPPSTARSRTDGPRVEKAPASDATVSDVPDSDSDAATAPAEAPAKSPPKSRTDEPRKSRTDEGSASDGRKESVDE